MTGDGLRTGSTGTLVELALDYLGRGPADSTELAHHVLGVSAATPPIAERLASALLGADPRVHRGADARWELVRTAAGSPGLAECAFAVVDVETTGSRPGHGDRIIEIAVVVLSGGSVDVVVDSLVDPERPIPRAITGVTRITQADVHGMPVYAEIADDVVGALAGRIFVAHNVRFDWSFVSSETRRVLDVVLEGPRLCTAQLARRLIPGLRSRSLDSVTRYFGIEIARRHRAGADATATAWVLHRLLDLAADRGIETLRELEELVRRSRKQRRRKRRALPASMDEA